MTAILIPPSPPPKQPEHYSTSQQANSSRSRKNIFASKEREEPQSFLSSLISKIQTGTDPVTSQDLEQLHQVLDSYSQAEYHEQVPFLDRAYAQRCASHPPILVRYIGMVQDMLEPEYYMGQVNGVHTKYRDFYYNPANRTSGLQDVQYYENEIESSHLLEERQPLVVVPIPFTTSWLQEGIRGEVVIMGQKEESSDSRNENNPLMVDEGMSQLDSNPKKRGRSDDWKEPTRKNHKHESPSERPDRLDGSPHSARNGSGDGETWWEEGCMDSDIHHTPVLAKVYYDDSDVLDDKSRLKLNDVVEIVGLVSMDPFEAASRTVRDADEGLLEGCMDLLIPPPPSLLPRLHVLRHKKINMDRLADSIALKASPIAPILDIDSDRNFTIQTFSQHIFNNNAAAGEALLLSLLSLAERNVNSSTTTTNAIQMPSGKTLGCASLNIVCANADSCSILQDRLSRTLGDILPTMNSLTLSLEALNQKLLTPPAKNMIGRLEPSVMQMPKGSCLVINQGPITNGVVNENGKRTLMSLAKMTECHLMPYRFDGMMDLEFEADLQVIVLSTSEGRASHYENCPSKLLPCSMSIDCGNSVGRVDSHHEIPLDAIGRIRQYIARSRNSTGERSSTNIVLPQNVLNKAQHDFVQRRKERRKDPACANLKPEISEEDFHRWLTITRLEARSREEQIAGDTEYRIARISDWESALRLDDQMI